jgi:lipopolysaccharide transport system permease protein
MIMPELILEPGRTQQNNWRSLWRDRELFDFLAWRDLLVRYQQTVIGIAWAVLRPFLTMLCTIKAVMQGACRAGLPRSTWAD